MQMHVGSFVPGVRLVAVRQTFVLRGQEGSGCGCLAAPRSALLGSCPSPRRPHPSPSAAIRSPVAVAAARAAGVVASDKVAVSALPCVPPPYPVERSQRQDQGRGGCASCSVGGASWRATLWACVFQSSRSLRISLKARSKSAIRCCAASSFTAHTLVVLQPPPHRGAFSLFVGRAAK